MIKLRFQTIQGQLLSEQTVDQFPVLVGRDASAGIVLADNGISGKHVELDWDGKLLSIRDLGSRNGTFVGKERVTVAKVSAPCSVLLGSFVLMEVEIVRSAMIAREVSFMPKPLKRPEAPVPAMTAPLPAVAEIVEAELIEGWEIYWHQLKKMPPRPVLLAMLGLGLVFALLHFLVFRENFIFSIGTGFGAALGCAVISLIFAAIMALPGILFRGAYDIKPLFIQCCICSMLMTIQIAILRPAMLMEYFGYVAQFLSFPLIVLASVPGAYVFLFTTFSHKNAKSLLVTSLIFAAVGVFLESRKVLSVDRQTLMREALLGEFRGTRGLAGGATEVRAITDDIRAFGKQNFSSQ